MMDKGIDRLRLQRLLLEVLAYLAASANNAVSASKLYGPLRLMEGCERLIRAMDEVGIADPELLALADDVVRQGMVLSTDAEGSRAFTDQATLTLARKLKQVGSESGASAPS